MAYVVITTISLTWFLLTLIAVCFVLTATVTPKWLVAPTPHTIVSNLTDRTEVQRYESVGIDTRCMLIGRNNFSCASFDLEGLLTDESVYPTQWKIAKVFIILSLLIMVCSLVATLVTYCRQSICGKSIHNITGAAQATAGICALIALFLHPFGWGHPRVKRLCGVDASAFWTAECSLGWGFYCAIISIFLAFCCASLSTHVEAQNHQTKIIRRVEAGERLICVP